MASMFFFRVGCYTCTDFLISLLPHKFIVIRFSFCSFYINFLSLFSQISFIFLVYILFTYYQERIWYLCQVVILPFFLVSWLFSSVF